MAFNINVFNSCKFLAITATRYDGNSTSADIKITNFDPDTPGEYVAALNYDTATGRGRINVPTSNLSVPDGGVYKVCIIENGEEKACKPLLLKCNIDCCLVKLTNELLDCSCDCPKCASAMARAQKIFLLLQSAQSAVEIAASDISNTGYYQDILEKYKKAKEICDTSCGCDC